MLCSSSGEECVTDDDSDYTVGDVEGHQERREARYYSRRWRRECSVNR